jgi:hypothetical protein
MAADSIYVQSVALCVLVNEIHAKTELAKASAEAIIERCDRLVLEGGKADALITVASMANLILENAEGKSYSGFATGAGVEDAAVLVARSQEAVGVA